jgi:hypothetical protein
VSDSTGNLLPFRRPAAAPDPDPEALLTDIREARRIVREARLGGRLELLIDCAVAALESSTACRHIAGGQDNSEHG